MDALETRALKKKIEGLNDNDILGNVRKNFENLTPIYPKERLQ